MAKQPKSEIVSEELVDQFGNPDDLMPIPDRMKESKEDKPAETLEAPVRASVPEIRALPTKPVSRGESNSLAEIRARRDAHLANSRR